MTVIDDKRKKTLEFSDGKRVNIYHGFIGISPELNVVTGYDNYFDFPKEPDNWYHENLTPQERNELAEYMIHLWKAYQYQYGCQ